MTEKKEIVRFSIDLPATLHTQMMERAAELDMTGTRYMRSLLRKDLAEAEKQRTQGQDSEAKYPYA